MKLPVLLLMVLIVLPLAGATHDTNGSQGVHVSNGLVNAFFEFAQDAVRPPADVEGSLVLQSRDEPVVVKGSVLIRDDTNAAIEHGRTEPGLASGQVLKEVDEELAPFTTVTIPFTLLVHGIGPVWVVFQPDPGAAERVAVSMGQVIGLAPVTVSLVAPEHGERLVSVPGRPAALTVTLDALPGSNLTEVRLTASEAVDDVEIGSLVPGEPVTATLRVEADQGVRYRGVDRAVILPHLEGMSDGVAFSHPLYHHDGDVPTAVHPAVYVATESAVFVVPPEDAELGVAAVLDVVVLNAGTSSAHAKGEFRLSLPGMPHLDAVFQVEERVAPGRVAFVPLDWTPPAAGLWQLRMEDNIGERFVRSDQIRVSGPIAAVAIDLPLHPLERGMPFIAVAKLNASKDIGVEGFSLTAARAPREGVISIDDLVRMSAVDAMALQQGTAQAVALDLTPKATGWYDLYLVVDTNEGPSLHSVGHLVVTGSGGDWPLAASPMFLLGLLVGVHVMWRRRWVT